MAEVALILTEDWIPIILLIIGVIMGMSFIVGIRMGGK